MIFKQSYAMTSEERQVNIKLKAKHASTGVNSSIRKLAKRIENTYLKK